MIVYGLEGLDTDSATLVKLLKDHSNLVIVPPFPEVVSVVASLTVVLVFVEDNVPPFVGVVHIVTDVMLAKNPPQAPIFDMSVVHLIVNCPDAFSAVIALGSVVPFSVANKGADVFAPS